MNLKLKLKIVTVLILALLTGLTYVASQADAATYRCGAEDDPTWAWSRCGDHQRGVTDLRTGKKVIVGRCGFARLSANGNASGPRLKGDRWAELHPGCTVGPTDINRN